MLSLRKKEIGPEELFALNYERLLNWSLQLTGGDRHVAEDLLHDVFVLFSLHRPDLSTIENPEGYLYMMLRNLHISRLRRAARSPLRQLSIIDFDSAEMGLRTLTAHDRVLVQDQLRMVCRYACARKEKAKAACTLILRFFHGYYPSEVARVLRTSRPAVDVRLLHARNEARLVLENPRALKLMEGRRAVAAVPANFARAEDDFLDELRRMIFQSRQGRCLTPEQLKKLYRPGAAVQPRQAQLAHIVSCPDCLDEINRRLGIPLLCERHPADSITRESRKGGGRDGGGSPHGGGGLPAQRLKRLRRRAGEVFEHKPRELCVSVNGYVRGSQRVTSEYSELNLVVETAEPISFVEVLSEQEVRLLMLPVTAPPAGAGEQAVAVGLSDGRRLDLSVKFRSPWPALHILYHDPTYRVVEELASEPHGLEAHEEQALRETVEESARTVRGPWSIELPAARPWRRLFSGDIWLRPGALAAVMAMLLVALLLVWRLPGPDTVSASELLNRAMAAESETGDDLRIVLHRTINLEERAAEDGALVSRRRIQIWKSAERGLTARRLYDERGRLVAGEWRAADGSRTVYRTPHSQPAASPNESGASWSADQIWQLGPSATDFAALTGRAETAEVEERGDSYVITYEGEPKSAMRGLVRATLTVNRHHLRATAQTLTVRVGDKVRQLLFTEALYESWPKDAVAPAVFDPDAEFVRAGVIRVERSSATEDPAKAVAAGEPSAPTGATAATIGLEIEVLRLLSRAGADLGEQISVARTSQGALHVRAIVETEQRKAEILRVLQPVMDKSAVSVEVATAVEALTQEPQTRQQASPAVIQQVEPADERIPADQDLRRYFSRGEAADGDRLDADIIRFAVSASSRSRRALQHAWALKRLAGRFSPRELRALDAEARLKWLSMMHEHARAVRRETAALRQQLQPVFSAHGAAPAHAGALDEKADFVVAAERLVEWCSIVDAGTRSAFTVSTRPSAAPEIRSPQFWSALKGAELLAGQAERAAEILRRAPREQRDANTAPADSPPARREGENR